jgi:hypothetical protein
MLFRGLKVSCEHPFVILHRVLNFGEKAKFKLVAQFMKSMGCHRLIISHLNHLLSQLALDHWPRGGPGLAGVGKEDWVKAGMPGLALLWPALGHR